MQHDKKISVFSQPLVFPVAAVCILLFVLAVTETVQAASVDVRVNTVIIPDPCDVSLGGGDMVSGKVDFGELESKDLSSKQQQSVSKWFNVQLRNCGGDFDTAVPTLTVSGTTVGTTGNDVYLFRNPSSSAQNLGFIFFLGGKTVTWTGATEANITPASVFTPTNKLPASWKDGDISVAAAVSTGDSSTVNGKGRAGELTAALTFQFDYK